MSTKTKSKTTTKAKKENLAALALPALWERFKEATGESTRSPNKRFIVRRIEEALAARATAQPEPVEEARRPASRNARATELAQPSPEREPTTTASVSAPPKQRGRFTSMSIEELQAKYLEAVGRATGSDDRRYVELRDMWSRGSARRVLPGKSPRAAPHNRALSGGRMTLRFPLREACMATSAGSWRSQGERA